MRILIMVLSFNEPPFDDLMRAQKASWDSENVPGIDTAYYYGGCEAPSVEVIRQGHKSVSADVRLPITDEYYLMAGKLKLALKLLPIGKYDFIFRTNSSSYVSKKELMKFAEKLPLNKCYAGWTVSDTNDDGGDCVSGAGIFLSIDCADILMNEIDPQKEIEEDVYIGRILRKHGIKAIDDKSRYDVETYFDENNLPLDRYHYRCKTGERIIDAKNMRVIHKIINNEKDKSS